MGIKQCECGTWIEFVDGVPIEVDTGQNHFINCPYKDKYRKKEAKEKPLPEGHTQAFFVLDGPNPKIRFKKVERK